MWVSKDRLGNWSVIPSSENILNFSSLFLERRVIIADELQSGHLKVK